MSILDDETCNAISHAAYRAAIGVTIERRLADRHELDVIMNSVIAGMTTALVSALIASNVRREDVANLTDSTILPFFDQIEEQMREHPELADDYRPFRRPDA